MSRESSFDEAMDRYAEGDEAAFATLHGGLYPRLRAFLTRLSGSALLGEDLVQETFLRMHRARGTFARGAPVVPWAYAIARNVWIEQVRSRRTRIERQSASLDEELAFEPETGPDADSEQIAVMREAEAVVARVLAGLPASQREAFLLIRYEGFSVQEAAAVVGCTEGALKLRAFRAYEALRDALGLADSSNRGSHE